MRWLAYALGITAVAAAPATVEAATWGSFDSSRINYPEGCLTCSANTMLHAEIEAAGDTVATPTALLDDAYLSGVDVFYTSLLSSVTGELSPLEQLALATWVEEGGTLIVTAETFSGPLADAYNSYTAPFGVTNYLIGSGITTGQPTAVHPVTQNVALYTYNLESVFDEGPFGFQIGDNGVGENFMTVLEPDTGFCLGGRILVIGDHNMFTDGMYATTDNEVLAANIVAWAGSAFDPPSRSELCVECGNGTIEFNEECDLGIANADNAACKHDCTLNVCGDGAVWLGFEECDDAGTEDGDGCSSVCTIEEAGSSSSGATDSSGSSESTGGADSSTSTDSTGGRTTTGADDSTGGLSTSGPASTTNEGNQTSTDDDGGSSDGSGGQDNDAEDGCSCHSQPSSPLSWLGLLSLGFLVRRSRRPIASRMRRASSGRRNAA